MAPSLPALLAAVADPAGPGPALSVLGWSLSLIAGTLWVVGFVSLSRSPLDERGRLPWAGTMLLLPVLGTLIWFWWRHRYYPARRAEQPGWDPNARQAPVTPPRRSEKVLPQRRYGSVTDER